MIELTELQRDALGEVFNIGVGRAAASLSTLVNESVELTAPSVLICEPGEVRELLLASHITRLSAVVQDFSGPFDAKAMLVFPETNALEIVRLMIGDADFSAQEISEYEQEAMCEVGNIILNACISAVADCFRVDISGGLPVHCVGDCDSLLNGDLLSGSESPFMLLLKVSLLISKKCIDGHVVFMMRIPSLTLLLRLLDQYLVELGLV